MQELLLKLFKSGGGCRKFEEKLVIHKVKYLDEEKCLINSVKSTQKIKKHVLSYKFALALLIKQGLTSYLQI